MPPGRKNQKPMKKLIKDWWPLLLIAGWWLWKKTRRKQGLDYVAPVIGNDTEIHYSYRLVENPLSIKKSAIKWVWLGLVYNGRLNIQMVIPDPYLVPLGGSTNMGATGVAFISRVEKVGDEYRFWNSYQNVEYGYWPIPEKRLHEFQFYVKIYEVDKNT